MIPLHVDGMQGLGDNLYQVPIIKMLREKEKNNAIYLTTPWPEFYINEGISNLLFVNPNSTLRTQKKNSSRFRDYVRAPFSRRMRLTYTPMLKSGIPLYSGLLHSVRMINQAENYFLTLGPVISYRRRCALIRPVTYRREWPARARGPSPEYIQWAIDYLNSKKIETIVVADVDGADEVYEGARPRNASVYFEKGELKSEEVLKLCAESLVAVGGPGFLAPMCLGVGTPGVIIHGGCGKLNSPHMLDAPGPGELVHVLPEKYCMCSQKVHACDKTIDLCKLKNALDTALELSAQPSLAIGRVTNPA